MQIAQHGLGNWGFLPLVAHFLPWMGRKIRNLAHLLPREADFEIRSNGLRTGRRREMTIRRTVALATPVAALMLSGLPAHACDSNYPWLCKPVPSVASSETTETRPSKPLPITSQRKDAKAAKPVRRAAVKPAQANAKIQHAAQTRAQHAARQAAARRLVLRARQPNVAAAPVVAEDQITTSRESTKVVATKPSERAQKPAAQSGDIADAGTEPNAGFAAAWERSMGSPRPVGAAAATEARESASEPAPVPPVPVASQNEVNEIDLAAPEPTAQSDGSWLRPFFIAFGGILALGSALRLFL
jgi:hypothetical protein